MRSIWAALLTGSLVLAATGAQAALGRGFGPICPHQPSLAWPVKRAILDCERLLSDPSTQRHPEDKANVYYNLGLLHHFDNRPDLAVESYTQAIGWMRNFADAYAARGDAYQALGQLDKANADFAQLAQLPKDSQSALNGRCWIRALRGQPLDLALADCNEALKQVPDDWMAFDSRCLVHYRMGNYAAAMSDCSEVVKHRPKESGSLYIRGLAKLRSGDAEGGDADVAAAKDADDKVVAAYAVYGVTQ
jgi:tetratricopeptide (TPR) repeat protein